jgi:hypothetical protein
LKDTSLRLFELSKEYSIFGGDEAFISRDGDFVIFRLFSKTIFSEETNHLIKYSIYATRIESNSHVDTEKNCEDSPYAGECGFRLTGNGWVVTYIYREIPR